MQEIDRAQRLLTRAIGSLQSPILVDPDTQEEWRPGQARPADLEVRPSHELSRSALRDLEQARSLLRQALEGYQGIPDADQTTVALARSALGQIERTLGLYHTEAAANARTTAYGALGDARRLTDALRSSTNLADHFERLAGMSNQDIDQLRAQLGTRAQELQGQIEQLQSRMDGNAQAHREMLNRRAPLENRVAELRIASGQASDAEALEMLLDAAEVAEQVNELTARIAELEAQLQMDQQEMRQLEMHRSQLMARQQAAERVLQDRQTATAGAHEQYQQVAGQIEQILSTSAGNAQSLPARLAAAAEAVEQARASEDAAADAFERALALLGQAEQLPTGAREESFVSDLRMKRGHTRTTLAYMESQRLVLGREIEVVLEEVGEAMRRFGGDAPPSVAVLQGYMQNAQGAREQAATRYEQAIEDFAAAGRGMPARLRWIAEGRQVQAKVPLAVLRGDRELLREAREEYDRLLEGNVSPDLVRYGEAIVRAGQQIQ